jgi:putative transposase
LVGPDGLLAGATTHRSADRALDTEMTEHLGYEKGDRTGARSGNHRNGSSPKTPAAQTSGTAASARTEVGR